MEILSTEVSKHQKRYSDSEKIALLQSWRTSGLSCRAFCRQVKISIGSFYKWMKEFKSQQHDASMKSKTENWLPLKVISGEKEPDISVKLPNGIEIKFSENASLEHIANFIKDLQK